MDREEFKIRTSEIKSLISEGRFPEAAKMADSIDWKRSKSVNMLCIAGDLYKRVGKFQKSRNVMMLAYERDPGNEMIVYSLCELAIRLNDYIGAMEYMKEYIRLAPNSSDRYILHYKFYEMQGVGPGERAELLEQYRMVDYKPRWVFELAKLYCELGDTARMCAICDEMYEYLGTRQDGASHKYVTKALDLKSRYYQLTDTQEAYLNSARIFYGLVPEPEPEPQVQQMVPGSVFTDPATGQMFAVAADGQAYPVQTGAAAPQETYLPDETRVFDAVDAGAQGAAQGYVSDQTMVFAPPAQGGRPIPAPYAPKPVMPVTDETRIYQAPIGIEVPVPDVENRFNTMNLQEELKKNVQVVIPEEQEQAEAAGRRAGKHGGAESSAEERRRRREERRAERRGERHEEPGEKTRVIGGDSRAAVRDPRVVEPEARVVRPEPRVVMPEDSRFDSILSQEDDGQISLVMPEENVEEQQIPGQISIEDIMRRIREESRSSQNERVKQIVQGRTEGMFNSFERTAKEGPQEELDQMLGVGSAAADKSGAMAGVAVASVIRPKELPLPEPAEEEPLPAMPTATNALEALTLHRMMEEQRESVRELEAQEKGVPAEQPEAELPEEEEDATADAAIELKEFAEEVTDEEEGDATADAKEVIKEIAEEEADEEEEDASADAEEVIEETAEEEADEEEEDASADAKEVIEETAEEEAGEEEEDATADAEEVIEETAEEEAGEEEEDASADAEEVIEETAEEEADEEEEDASADAEEETGEPAEEEKTEKQKPPSLADDEEKPLTEDDVARRIEDLSEGEKNLFGPILHKKETCRQIVIATDVLAARRRNGVVVIGKDNDQSLNVAKGLIRAATKNYASFSGKVAKIKGDSLTAAKIPEIFSQLKHGALIVLSAARIGKEAKAALTEAMIENARFTMVVINDTDKNIRDLMNRDEKFAALFETQVDADSTGFEALVAFGREYAREREHSIDNLGVLALHTRIEELQSYDHQPTTDEVEEIIEEAIRHANRRSFGHFIDVLAHKRYDEEDMIILREKDFLPD